MSKGIVNITSPSAEETSFFRSGKNSRILKQLLDGKTIDEICVDLNLRKESIVKSVKNKHMLSRIEEFLSVKAFDLELKKTIAKMNAFDLLRKEFETRITAASPDTIVKEYLRVLSEKEGKGARLDFIKIIINNLNKEATKDREANLEDDFGYKPLKAEEGIVKSIDQAKDGNTNPSNPPMDKGERVEDKQGPAD